MIFQIALDFLGISDQKRKIYAIENDRIEYKFRQARRCRKTTPLSSILEISATTGEYKADKCIEI